MHNNKNRKVFIKSSLMAFLFSGCILASHAGTIQPYSDGIQPLLNRLSEIERSLLLYKTELASGNAPVNRTTHLEIEKISLVQEQIKLQEQLESSS